MRRILGWVGLSVFIFAQVALAQPTPEQTWALSIGISEYDPADLTLQWADKDATEFTTFLRYGLGIPENNYRILRNQEATRDNILAHLGWLAVSANPGDRVYIFYSGHGKQESPILPYDTINPIPLEKFKQALNKIDAQEVIMFADACYSGKLAGKGARAVTSEGLTGLSKGMVVEMTKAKTGTIIMTSANGIQQAFEKAGRKNGIFTYYLMKVLMDRNQYTDVDLDHDGRITLYEAYQRVSQAVSGESEQEPQISDLEKSHQVVLLAYAGAPTSVSDARPDVQRPQPASEPPPFVEAEQPGDNANQISLADAFTSQPSLQVEPTPPTAPSIIDEPPSIYVIPIPTQTQAETVMISGMARDDLGIAGIQVHLGLHGQPMAIHNVALGQDQGQLAVAFKEEYPLQIGNNDIRVMVQDLQGQSDMLPIQVVRVAPTPTPAPIFRVTTIVLTDDLGDIIAPQNGIYTVNMGQTVVIQVSVEYNQQDTLQVIWSARYGKVPSASQLRNTYTAQKTGPDIVMVYIWNQTTGDAIEVPINITVVP